MEARRHTYGPVGRPLQWPRGEKIMAWVRVGGSEMDIMDIFQMEQLHEGGLKGKIKRQRGMDTKEGRSTSLVFCLQTQCPGVSG